MTPPRSSTPRSGSSRKAHSSNRGPAWKRWAKRIGIALLILALLPLLAMEGFDRWLSSDRGAKWLYRKAAASLQIHRSADGLRWLEIGRADLAPLVLLHGSPGGLFDWKALVEDSMLLQHYRLIVPERPGYGATKPRGAEPSIMEQADRILAALSGEAMPLTLLGYSYGGPVAVAMAGAAPERIDGVIGLAGQYDPDNEMILSVSPYLQFGLFRYLMPRWLWVSNEEKMNHQEALRKAMLLFERAQCPIWLIHGTEDAIVPTDNSPWLAEHLQQHAGYGLLRGRPDGGAHAAQSLFLDLREGKDHSIPFSEPELVAEAALHWKATVVDAATDAGSGLP